MKQTPLLLLLAGLFFTACNSEPQVMDPIKARIDSLANEYLSDTLTASLAIGIYRKGSTTPEMYYYGTVNKNINKLPDSTTIYKLGSIGKTFTATTLAWYVVNKPQTVQLNNAINTFFPASQKLPFWITGGSTDTTFISLANLAMHYSSLPDSPPNRVDPPNYTVEKLLEFIGSSNPKWHVRPLRVQPGTEWVYSNTGFGLLGVVMEKISGMSYQALLDTVFCNELNMEDTRLQLNAEQLSRLATGYSGGDTVPYKLTSPAFYGAGGNFSTLNDMMKYLAWNMGLTNSSLNNLLDTLHMVRDTTNKPKGWQGLAWQVNYLNPGSKVRYIWKDGATTGYGAFVCFVKETGTGVVVLGNNFDKGDKFDAVGVNVLRVLTKE